MNRRAKAESVMIAGLFVVYGRDYVDLCKKLRKIDEAIRAQKLVDIMVEVIKKYGWDGEWFIRAYDYYGRKIFIESQGWCTMAGIREVTIDGLPYKSNLIPVFGDGKEHKVKIVLG